MKQNTTKSVSDEETKHEVMERNILKREAKKTINTQQKPLFISKM